MTEDQYREKILEIERKAELEYQAALAEARTKVIIPMSRRARYALLIDGIAAMIAQPTRDRIEREMKIASEAVEREYYREQGLC